MAPVYTLLSNRRPFSTEKMKLFILAVCCVALAAARPQEGGGKGDKKGKGNPVEGLVKLCFRLAEEALGDEEKRSWEDVFGQLAPICEAILEELEDDDDDGSDGKSKMRPSGPPPSGEPPKPSGSPDFEDRSMEEGKGQKQKGNGKKGGQGRKDDNDSDDDDEDDDKMSGPRPSGPPPSGPPPSGAPPSKNYARGKKGGKSGKGKGDEGSDGEGDLNGEVLLKICEGLAKMAEKKEEGGEAGRSLDALLEAMKGVCEAAFYQAEEDAANV